MLNDQNKFFDISRACYARNGFTNTYLAKQFEKKNLKI